jgi:PE family
MAYVIAAPEMMETASTDLATIGSTLNAAHMAAAAPTVAVMPAAADEVSASIAQLFSQHAQDYQASARQAAAFQDQFAQNLKTSAASYTSIEDAIASLLQGLKASVRSFGTALEGQIVHAVGGALLQLFTLFPENLYPAIFGFVLISGVGVAVVIGLLEVIIETITGQAALI